MLRENDLLAMHITRNDPIPQEADKPHDRNLAWGARGKGAMYSDATALGTNDKIVWGLRMSHDGIDDMLMKEAKTTELRARAYEVAKTVAVENKTLHSSDLPDVRRALKEPASLEYVTAMAECPELCQQSTMSASVVKGFSRHPGFDVSNPLSLSLDP